MATQNSTVGTDWVQITDGTQTKTLQVITGTILLADSPSAPAPNAWMGHEISADDIEPWVTITPPHQMWARAAGDTRAFWATIAIS